MSNSDEFKALDNKVEKLSTILEKYLDSQEVSFVIQGETLYNHEVSAHFGCLPLFLLKAKDTYEKVFNNAYSPDELAQFLNIDANFVNTLENAKNMNQVKIEKTFPIDFIENESSYFNSSPVMLSNTNGAVFSIVSHFTFYSIEEYVKQYKRNRGLMIDGKIPLDPLAEEWELAVRNRLVEIKKPTMVLGNINN
jgi:hypothetical protein